MSAHETATGAENAKTTKPVRTKAERERAERDWMRRFVGAVKMGFEFDTQEYFDKYGE